MAKYKWDNLILFVEQLATAAKLKLPLDKAIHVMSLESLDRGWGRAQESVSENVRMGASLADAMENYPQYFPGMICRLVRVGEEGDVLSAMLSSMARYIETAREVQQRMRKCLIYPLIVWTLILVNMTIYFTFVYPKFVEMFSSLGGSVQANSLYFSIGPAVLIVGEGVFLLLAWLVLGALGGDLEGKSNQSVLSSRLLMFTPFLGTLHRHAKAAEVCEVLGILVEGGRQGREAIELAKETMTSPAARLALEDVDTALMAGKAYEPDGYSAFIPQTTLWMISETEGENELGRTLQSIASHHRRQMELLSALIREIIEPFLFFTVAVLGALVLVSVYTTIFSIPGMINM